MKCRENEQYDGEKWDYDFDLDIDRFSGLFDNLRNLASTSNNDRIPIVNEIPPKYVEFDGDAPLPFVVSRNLCRRHLSESQRAMVAAAIIELQRKENGRSEVTISEAAKQLNVSERSVYHAAKVLHEGTEQDVEALIALFINFFLYKYRFRS
jgi:hypothetical protein